MSRCGAKHETTIYGGRGERKLNFFVFLGLLHWPLRLSHAVVVLRYHRCDRTYSRLSVSELLLLFCVSNI